jgi:hypothetical protein
MKVQLADKDSNKEVALGTSKIVRLPDGFVERVDE